ncbi:MAG: hypothetical protein LPJ87_05720 [Zoogloeaceae bacterium]|nr:hypothetical protein [Zoogloeaceae bacterium]
MDSVNPSSTMSPYTNQAAAPSRAPDEQQPRPATSVQQTPNAPRVNEGPSTVTTLSPQAQQLARAEETGSASPPEAAPPRNDNRPAENSQEAASTQPAAQANNGRAFDDRSSTGALLRT